MSGKKLFFEDLTPGEMGTHGHVTVTADEIRSFAEAFDPQPFHLDDAAARETHFGGLSASGWHTCAMMMSLLVERWLLDSAGLGSPGFDDLRWLRPVRPGDRLGVRLTCLEKTPSRSRPDRGLVRFFVEVLNQDDVCVMSLKLMALFARRDTVSHDGG